MERYDSRRPFTPAVLRSVETAFTRQFGRPLPISAQGDTALHRALGLDHSGRVDVAIHPDSPEGVWLRKYLGSQHIPVLRVPDCHARQCDRAAHPHRTRECPLQNEPNGLDPSVLRRSVTRSCPTPHLSLEE